MTCFTVTAILLAVVAPAAAAPGQAAPPTAPRKPFVPTSQYAARRIQGWTVRVSRELLGERRALGAEALALLEAKLVEVRRAVPTGALAALRKVPIWLGVDDGHAPCAEYHPSKQWLADNGYNPDKARCVEIGCAERFLAWSADQPAMVLHELAHAYQDQVLGDRPELEAGYQAAVRGGKYDAVLHCSGRTERAYALTNAKEFFAESSEAYFGTNDFYPFVRAELRQYDPATFRLMRELWGDGSRTKPGAAPEAYP